MKLESLAREFVCDIPVYEPGRPIEEVARELGLKPAGIVKLASNENALGPSPRAVAAMRAALNTAHLYPDGGAFYLRAALARKLGVRPENLIFGAGSNEIIEFLFHAFVAPGDEVVVGDRAFVIYKFMCRMFQARCVEVPFREHTHDLAAMREAVTTKTKLVFVANPNNPTGTRVSNAELDQFICALPAHVIAVLDEAYIEFLDDPPPSIEWAVGRMDVRSQARSAARSAVGLQYATPQTAWLTTNAHRAEGAKVVLLRTFSKIVGLAGLRIGYGIASPECIAVLQRVRQPFNVNAVAQAGALAALGDTAHIRRTKAMTRRGLASLEKEFRRLGLEFVPSCANFVLVRVGDGDAVFQKLQQQGVIVRPMRAYQMPDWVRVTVGLPAENRKFVAALERVVAPPTISGGSCGRRRRRS